MLRNYQEETVKKMLWGITLEGNGLVSIPKKYDIIRICHINT